MLFSLDDETISTGSIDFGTKLQLIREENFQLAFLSMVSIENEEQEITTKIVGANNITKILAWVILLDTNQPITFTIRL